jgi:hypothetical protein
MLSSIVLLGIFAPAAEAMEVRGLVVDHLGKPVPGAEVYLTEQNPIESASPDACATSGPDGRFTLTPPPASGEIDPAYLGTVFFAHKPGVGVGGRRVGESFWPTRPVVLELGRPVKRIFRVLDPSGQPISDLAVTLDYAYARGGFSIGKSARVGIPDVFKTDADGRFIVDAFPDQCTMSFSVDQEPFGKQQFQFEATGAGAVHEFRLHNTGRVVGQVIARELELKGMEIHAYSLSPNESKAKSYGSATVHPDANGRFEIPTIMAG